MEVNPCLLNEWGLRRTVPTWTASLAKFTVIGVRTTGLTRKLSLHGLKTEAKGSLVIQEPGPGWAGSTEQRRRPSRLLAGPSSLGSCRSWEAACCMVQAPRAQGGWVGGWE